MGDRLAAKIQREWKGIDMMWLSHSDTSRTAALANRTSIEYSVP